MVGQSLHHSPSAIQKILTKEITMKSLLFLILLSLTLCFIEATPTPKIPTKTLSQSCASKMSFGGVPRRAFTTRGGEVLVAESGDDLERILIQANGALVVVDYWAR